MNKLRYNPFPEMKRILIKLNLIHPGNITKPDVFMNNNTNIFNISYYLNKKNIKYICINDDYSTINTKLYQKQLYLNFVLNKLYNFKAPWEIYFYNILQHFLLYLLIYIITFASIMLSIFPNDYSIEKYILNIHYLPNFYPNYFFIINLLLLYPTINNSMTSICLPACIFFIQNSFHIIYWKCNYTRTICI